MRFLNKLFGGGRRPIPPNAESHPALSPPPPPPSTPVETHPVVAPPVAPSNGKCDVCTEVILRCDGFILTTKQVVTEVAYWKHLFQNQGRQLLVGNPATQMELICGFAKQQADSATGWLVCEQCSPMFTFDHAIARKCAVDGTQPPGIGPADAREVMTKAIYSRTMLETSPPQAGSTTQPTAKVNPQAPGNTSQFPQGWTPVCSLAYLFIAAGYQEGSGWGNEVIPIAERLNYSHGIPLEDAGRSLALAYEHAKRLRPDGGPPAEAYLRSLVLAASQIKGQKRSILEDILLNISELIARSGGETNEKKALFNTCTSMWGI